MIQERLIRFRPGMDYNKPDYTKHNDYVQWALQDAFSHNDPSEHNPLMITKRLTILSFAAIQSSVITITNVLFVIASTTPSTQIQQDLRDEVEASLSTHHVTTWEIVNLAKMARIDSALRESMRLWGFVSRGVLKMVVAPGGIQIPSWEHLPYGAEVGVMAYAVHHDESIYRSAFEYDAFRFSWAKERPTLPKVPSSGGQNPRKLPR